MACFCAASKPAVSTTAALVPPSPRALISPGTLAGGVQIRASSGACGSAATSAKQGASSIMLCLGFTGQIGPVKPPLRRLRQTVPPTLLARGEAPITATEAGSKRKSRWRMLMQR
jgi:hypothetical protein